MSALLNVQDLSFVVDRRPVLEGINLQLQRGEFVALIGPNGSGKTTLMHCIAGILTPSTGRACIDGIDVATDPCGARYRLGFGVDPAQLPPLLTGRECLELFAGARGLAGVPGATLRLAESLALTPVLEARVGRYSLGMRQKLGVLLGLLGEPPLLLLDEPINGLDPTSAWALKRHLQALVQEGGTTVLIATHSLDLAERFATRAVLLVDGRLRREWNATGLATLRASSGESLEQAMVAALA